jgi:hypothetical protein
MDPSQFHLEIDFWYDTQTLVCIKCKQDINIFQDVTLEDLIKTAEAHECEK